MKQIEFFDTTLRDGEQTPGVSFTIEEKIAIATQLENWGIDVIEAGFPAASPDSFTAVKEISKILTKTSVTGLARCVKNDIDKAYEALKEARTPQIHVFIATSPIHMQYKLKMTPEQVLENITKHVSYACERFDIVEFSPEDATRTERDFLLKAVQTAVDAGATYINIPDTVGYTTPLEYTDIFTFLISNVESNRNIIFSPHCHDDLGMAVANSLAAIKAGAGRVEGTVTGIGERAGNAALEEIAIALHIRKDFYGVKSPLKLEKTFNTCSLVSQMSGISIPKNKAVVGGNAFAHQSGIHQDGVLKNPETYEIISPELVGIKNNSLPLGKLSGRHAFIEKLKELELVYKEEDVEELFSRFKNLADKKKDVTDSDVIAIVSGKIATNSDEISFESVRIDNKTAIVVLNKGDGTKINLTGTGMGSVDSIFKAIDSFFMSDINLKTYSVDAVTSGIDSQASVHVTIEDNTGKEFNSRGVDYDVLAASAISYINANKLVKKGM